MSKDLSIYVFPPSGSNVTKMLPLKINPSGTPEITGTINIPADGIKFSYHPATGYKHFKTTASAALLKAHNTKQKLEGKLFEPLLRIFPKNPETMQFVAIAGKRDIIVDGKVSEYKPVSLILHATNADVSAISVSGPKGGSFTVTSSFGHLSLVCTAMPMTKNDKPLYEWPTETMWTTPY